MQLPHLHSVSPEKIQDLIFDLELRRSGAKIHYAVDPYEIFEFCFPINPSEIRNRPPIDVIADDQAALYELFYVRKERPLLVEEYVRELQRILGYFEHTVDYVYTRAEMIDALIKEGGLEEIAGENRRDEEALLNAVQEDFNVILAVAMGIYSVGIDRFRDVFRNRLQMGRLELRDGPIQELFAAYEPTELSDVMYESLSGGLSEQVDSSLEVERRKRADRVDAQAVDRLIYLNKGLEKLYIEKKIATRHVILYLSSALKTERLFSIPAVKAALPRIEGKCFSFWRTRAQVFAYVVHKSEHTKEKRKIEESIKNLKNVKEVLEQIDRLGQSFSQSSSECSQCVLEGGSPTTCGLKDFCEKVMALDTAIQKRRKEIHNLGLITTLGSYERIRDARPTEKSYKAFIKFFGEVFKQGFKDLALERMQQMQWLMKAKTEFANMLPGAISDLAKAQQDRSFFRSGRDAITGVAQYLPSKPRISSEKYSDILALILAFYRDPSQDRLIEDAYKSYISIDADRTGLDLEHELVRCLLYLAFSKSEGNENAYDHADGIISQEELFEADPKLEPEYQYVLCWAARRIKNFERSNELATHAIHKWPQDPRFHHGHCLNTFAWLSDEEQQANCPYKLRDAIDDTNTAINLYLEDETNNRELIAVNYNNLSYLLALDSTDDDYSLDEARHVMEEARAALNALKLIVSKDSWNPHYPEYFHTEAYVEYREYQVAKGRRENPNQLIAKLEHARREIDVAIELSWKQSYSDLKKRIEKDISKLVNGPKTRTDKGAAKVLL